MSRSLRQLRPRMKFGAGISTVVPESVTQSTSGGLGSRPSSLMRPRFSGMFRTSTSCSPRCSRAAPVAGSGVGIRTTPVRARRSVSTRWQRTLPRRRPLGLVCSSTLVGLRPTRHSRRDSPANPPSFGPSDDRSSVDLLCRRIVSSISHTVSARSAPSLRSTSFTTLEAASTLRTGSCTRSPLGMPCRSMRQSCTSSNVNAPPSERGHRSASSHASRV
mmetsp:Transcript_8817/g.22814  ORF Transcript_8817/g.22814 Transcript_8817/m.22814 type:complete len:218 (+) Transcript_8817:1230-1883(+)